MQAIYVRLAVTALLMVCVSERERGRRDSVRETSRERITENVSEREREVKIKPRHGKETKRQKRKTER